MNNFEYGLSDSKNVDFFECEVFPWSFFGCINFRNVSWPLSIYKEEIVRISSKINHLKWKPVKRVSSCDSSFPLVIPRKLICVRHHVLFAHETQLSSEDTNLSVYFLACCYVFGWRCAFFSSTSEFVSWRLLPNWNVLSWNSLFLVKQWHKC